MLHKLIHRCPAAAAYTVTMPPEAVPERLRPRAIIERDRAVLRFRDEDEARHELAAFWISA